MSHRLHGKSDVHITIGSDVGMLSPNGGSTGAANINVDMPKINTKAISKAVMRFFIKIKPP